MEIEVGEYVRTIDGLVGIFDRYSKRPDTSIYKSPFNCFIKLPNRKTCLQCAEDYIAKHDKDIKKLIEVGDYVNGYYVRRIANYNNELCTFDLNVMQWIPLTEIDVFYKIVTHEQFESIEYKVEEDK